MKNIIIAVLSAALVTTAVAEETQTTDERIAALEQQVQYLSDELEMQEAYGDSGDEGGTGGFRFGGYGEIHGNFEENGESVFDIHRLVMYIGYEFAD